ncbi:MAG: hypothetical protein AM325_016035 [Candidatus Thorarchaeota archaeon SMTZ1-45]|nr:MAG: hypothetical protein AM325_16830 [Candidatus Thorarchaeota archaeon SMTZ1-45]
MSKQEKLDVPDVAFSPDQGVDATKDFNGYIVDAEYGLDPLGMVGKAEFQKRPQLAIQIRTEAYEKDQYEWYAPTRVNKTKWMYFIDAMNKCGALKETDSSGKNTDEKMASFAKSLVGMNFRWLEQGNLESAGQQDIKRLLLPDTYFGKVEIEEPIKVESEEVTLE